ncbi:ATP-binding protein [Sediminispirochaeta smaragdinae]
MKRTGGFGLGLYLVRKIVIAHDGFVELESGVGRGTLVRISMPQISR